VPSVRSYHSLLLPVDSKKSAVGLTPFLNSPHGEYHPEFSPDGRWIAYASDESGELEV